MKTPSGSHILMLKAPYECFQAIEELGADAHPSGSVLVWPVSRESLDAGDFDLIANRPRGVSCVIILPSASDIPTIAPFLHRLPDASPNAVLPSGRLATPFGVRAALAAFPRSLPKAVTDYLWRHRVVDDQAARIEIQRVFQMAPRTATIGQLCREMYLSRRTLGRHFEARGLPVPSHWLQFARILNVLLRAQAERRAMFKIAIATGYPDGFTFSNQVKRLIGVRPSAARELVGFEWLVEAWLKREHENRDSISPDEDCFD